MNVTLIDDLGQEHIVEATLTGICPAGHDCYMIICPFPIDGTRMPELRLNELTSDAHIQVVGMGITVDGGTQPFMAYPHQPRDDRFTRIGRVLLYLAAIFQLYQSAVALAGGDFYDAGLHFTVAVAAMVMLVRMRP